MGTSKPINLVPLFHLKFLNVICRLWCRNFEWAAPGNSDVATVMKTRLTGHGAGGEAT
jgi:hypothetical protein